MTPQRRLRWTPLAWAVLGEVLRLLETLADGGAGGTIDLRSLPLTQADRSELESLLGRGEVRAELDLAGRSEIWETAYPGAWWIRHLGAGDRVAAELIAVCAVPDLFAAHPVDVRAGTRRLSRLLSTQGPPENAHA